MKKILILIVLFISGFSNCYSCSCVMGKPDFVLFGNTEVIFTGKIIQITSNSASTNRLTFKIYKVYKGEKTDTTIAVITNKGNGMCGINGKIGEKFLIFANYDNGGLRTDICMHSALIKKSKDELSMLNSISRMGNKWYEDGSLAADGDMDHNMPVGQWKFYKKGKVIMEGTYLNGQKNGEWINYRYATNGETMKTTTNYSMGQIVTKP